jgi:hypothetical protein
MEIMKMPNAYDTVSGLQVNIARTTPAQSWYTRIKTWWAARRGADHAALNACWDPRREAVRPLRADAARDMVPQTCVHTAVSAYCALVL